MTYIKFYINGVTVFRNGKNKCKNYTFLRAVLYIFISLISEFFTSTSKHGLTNAWADPVGVIKNFVKRVANT